MKGVFSRLIGRRSPRNRPAHRRGSTTYRSAWCAPLRPDQVSRRRFNLTARFRRGFDPDEVRAFLDRVAAELAAAHREVERSQAEAHRVREALRAWQSQQARTRDLYAGYR